MTNQEYQFMLTNTYSQVLKVSAGNTQEAYMAANEFALDPDNWEELVEASFEDIIGEDGEVIESGNVIAVKLLGEQGQFDLGQPYERN